MKINSEAYFKGIVGYKLEKGHFELGSNLHVQDYYYAKRLFYNSFYSNRFAFLLCRTILERFNYLIEEHVQGNYLKKRTPTLTLLGYENFSDLLISNVRKMLNDYLKIKHSITKDIFNHDIYVKDQLFLKNPKKINNHAILIFPISTTFSTSLRIQEEINELFSTGKIKKKIFFQNPVLNCVIISNKDLREIDKIDPKSIEYAFGWKRASFKDRMIEVGTVNSMDDETAPKAVQQYMIALRSEWHKINNCPSCYPSDMSDEKCLMETQNLSVTPNLIFNYPKVIDEQADRNIFGYFQIKTESGTLQPMIFRRHFVRYSNHYIYYIRVGRFLQENKVAVTKWLADHFDILKKPKYRNIVIVTPTIGANSGFVNLVNDVLFSDVATIIQFNPHDEFLHNFKLFYGEIIKSADCVIYVDDVLATTKSFSALNFYVKATKSNEGIDFVISLVNRTGFFNNQKLTMKLKKVEDQPTSKRLYNFLQVHVPPIAHRDKYPFMSLMEKFVDLSNMSVLDSMRIHFKGKENAFRPFDLTQDVTELDGAARPRALLQFLMEHEFMKLFAVRSDDKNTSYIHTGILKNAFENREHKSNSYESILLWWSQTNKDNSLNSFLKVYPEFKAEIKNALYKVCSIDPYIHYHPMKLAVFNWVLADLNAFVNRIKEEKLNAKFFDAIQNGLPANYSRFENFKFLMKRAAKLKINYIYSLEFLLAIEKIIRAVEKIGTITYYEQLPSDRLALYEKPKLKPIRSRDISVMEFIHYYVGLLQELIIQHESKALKLVVNIKKIIDMRSNGGRGRTLKNSYNDNFMYLLRLLVLENTFIFHNSSEKLLKKTTVSPRFDKLQKTAFFDNLDTFFNTYPFDYNRMMLSRFSTNAQNETLYETEEPSVLSFYNMLLLKAILKKDLKKTQEPEKVSIKEKVNRILEIACSILDIKKGGAFLAVKYKNKEMPAHQDDIAIVGEYAVDKRYTFKPTYFSAQSFLFKMFDGIPERTGATPPSTFEISFDQNARYHFRTAQGLDYQDVAQFSEFRNELYENVFYVRITEIETDEDGDFQVIPQAVIGFYNNPMSEANQERFIKFQKDLSKGLGSQYTMEERHSYERLDPKKVRQLLLLRNDMSSFISHHLNNDSLRAYIDMINANQYTLSLHHGRNIYESSIKHYIDQINQSTTAEQAKEQAGFLNQLFNALSNKTHLIAIANRGDEVLKRTLVETKDVHTISDLVEAIRNAYPYILMLYQEQTGRINKLDSIVFDDSTISPAMLETKFILYEDIFNELVFESIYNIKKHAVQQNKYDINTLGTKLNISILTKEIDGVLFLSIRNNLCYKIPEFFSKMNERLTYRRDTDGLNLLYNLIHRATDLQVHIEGEDGTFSLCIPLKTI